MTKHFFFLIGFVSMLVSASAHAADPSVQRSIESFTRGAMSSKPESAYAMLTSEMQRSLGEPQVVGYMHVRTEALGDLVSIGKVKRAEKSDVDGLTFYSVDLTFKKGVATSLFAVAKEGAGSIARFDIPLPHGFEAKLDEADYLMVMTDFVNLISNSGLVALADRVSSQSLAESNVTRADARALFADYDELLGKMTHYELDSALPRESCRTVPIEGDFERGHARVNLNLCQKDGLWEMVAGEVTPVLTPFIAEHQLQKAMSQKAGVAVRVSCPHDVAFEVGSDLHCRVEAGSETFDATVRRTSETEVKVVDIKKR